MPTPSASQITDALAGRSGVVRLSYRFQQRTHDFAFQADLTNAISKASIELDNDRAVVRTARFTIDPDRVEGDFNPAADHIAVIALLLVPMPDFSVEEVEIPMGLFHLEVPDRNFTPGSHELWDVEASDITTHLLTAKTANPYTVASGTNYITAVEQLIALFGLQHSLPATAATLPVAFTWAPGVPYLEIANALLAGINFYPLWSDGTGVLRSRERIDISTEIPVVSYSTSDEPRLIVSPYQKRQDTSRWANRIACVIDDPRRTAAFALRVNNDPDSPISVVSLTDPGGLPVVNSDPAISGGRVFDLATADAICMAELRDRNARAQPSILRTFPDPRRGPREFYAVTVEDEEFGTLFRAESWRLDLATGQMMQHALALAQSIDLSIVVALSGTVTAATEAQIIAGGRTIIYTLPTGYSWVAAGATFDAERGNFIDEASNRLVSLGVEAAGWNAEVVPILTPSIVVRTSASVVTITLPAAAPYNITVPEMITPSLPSSPIVGNPEPYIEPTFTVIP